MKILETIEKIGDIGHSRQELQKQINIATAFHLWDHLVARYDIIETTHVLLNFVQDIDLHLVIKQGLKLLQSQADEVEDILSKYGIPLPQKPPAASTSALNVEVISDRYIFRRIFSGIQSFIPIHAAALIHSTSPKNREVFRRFIDAELDIYDKFLLYGQLKGWVVEPPAYRV